MMENTDKAAAALLETLRTAGIDNFPELVAAMQLRVVVTWLASAVLVMVSMLAARFVCRMFLANKDNEAFQIGGVLGALACVVGILLGTLGFIFDFAPALTAMLEPQGYALDVILRRLGD